MIISSWNDLICKKRKYFIYIRRLETGFISSVVHTPEFLSSYYKSLIFHDMKIIGIGVLAKIFMGAIGTFLFLNELKLTIISCKECQTGFVCLTKSPG